MDEDSDQEDETRKRIAQNKKEEAAATNSSKSQLMKKDLPLPPNPDHVIIRRDYDPKAKQSQSASAAASNSKQGGDTYFKSPLTGELIPSSSMSEHMRIAMLDPRWIEQRQKEKKEREEQEEVLASGFSIEKNLKRLAEYRSDVFGRGDDEVIIGRKLGDEEEQQQQKKKEDSITWDGHKNTVEKTTNRALTGISAEDQIQKTNESQQQQSSVLIRPPVPPQTQTMMNLSNYKMLNTPVMTGMIRPPPQLLQQQQQPPPTSVPVNMMPQAMEVAFDDQPSSKRLKTEDTLIPEADYLAQHGSKGPVKFSVQVPNVPEKPEWNLNGQLIPFTMNLTETVNIDFVYTKKINNY
jgi:splicing factor 3A subunit 1